MCIRWMTKEKFESGTVARLSFLEKKIHSTAKT